uniref:Uncharacterized protein n=1 Tax=Medicago truncatula TaxID=3880 RepID=B7FKT9_MEDTR|nr:unknown [Medicago truncatula]
MKTKKNMMTMMMFEALKEVKDKVNEDDEIHQEQEQQNRSCCSPQPVLAHCFVQISSQKSLILCCFVPLFVHTTRHR